MYKILIVDDEAYFRTYLKACIKWGDYDYEICGEASNAEEAMSLLPNIMPDLILADIHMTGKDGIEFSREVKRKFPSVCIILITGFNEFEYARQAMRIGVSNYISKPFSNEELIDSILKVKETIHDIDSKKNLISTLKKQYNDNVTIVRNTVLYKLLTGGYGNNIDKAEHDLERIDLEIPAFPVIVSILECNLLNDGDEKVKDSISKEFCSITNQKCVTAFNGDCLIGITHFEKSNFEGYLKSCYSKLISKIVTTYGVTASVGIGLLCQEICQIPDSFEKARIALKNKFLLGNNIAISYGSLKISGSSEELYSFGLKNDLMMYARLLDEAGVAKTITSIYNSLREKTISIDFVLILYTELLSICFSLLGEYGYSISEVFGVDFSPLKEILKDHTIKEVNEYVLSVYKKVISFLKSKKKINSLSTVKKVKEYIDHDYKKSLTIESVAAKVFLHPSYLRFLFKKEMGMTINEYITSVRMETAKSLLLKGKNNAEVAAMVGYSDATYFSKCFKKYYKMNPSQFEDNANVKNL